MSVLSELQRHARRIPLMGLQWPGGKRIAVVLSFDVDGEAGMLSLDANNRDRLGVLSAGAYGPNVGVPRILTLLADLGVRATFFVPGFTADMHPELIPAILRGGHEIGHHSYLHKRLDRCTAAEIDEELQRGLESLQRIGGVRPSGFRAPWWEFGCSVPDLLISNGFAYDSSLMDDDRPYLLTTQGGSLVELPVSFLLDDWEQYGFVSTPAMGSVIEENDKVFRLWAEEFDALCDEKASFILTLHPWLSGRASRVRLLARLIQYMQTTERVWFATCAELAALCKASVESSR